MKRGVNGMSMNIFLDSNIFYRDPFMSRGSLKMLIDNVKKYDWKVYITDVVYKEVLNNYEVELNNINAEIVRVKKNIEKLLLPHHLEEIDVCSEVKKLKERFNELLGNKQIIILYTDSSMLEEVVNRAIKRIKPFSKNKDEFRDCLIWLTYAQKVERDHLRNCFFINKNTSDFYDESKSRLHKDLLNDTKRIVVYQGINEFLDGEKGLIDRSLSNDVDIDICDLYDTDIFEQIEGECYLYINDNNIEILKNLSNNMDIEDTIVKLNDIEIIEAKIMSSLWNEKDGDIDISGTIAVYAYISVNYKKGNAELVRDTIKLNVDFYCKKRVKGIIKEKEEVNHNLDKELIGFICEGVSLTSFEEYELYLHFLEKENGDIIHI